MWPFKKTLKPIVGEAIGRETTRSNELEEALERISIHFDIPIFSKAKMDGDELHIVKIGLLYLLRENSGPKSKER